MRILAVDTATRCGSVAIMEGETLLVEVQVTSLKTHASRLMPTIETALGMADMDLRALDGFAVTIGPGSFTGLRIGISTVKGLAFAANKPVAGVSTLDALVHQFPGFPDLICPFLDARKGQVYTALFKAAGVDGWQRVAPDCAVEPGPWLEGIHGPCLMVGDGIAAYRSLIDAILGERARFAPPYQNSVRAAVVAHLGIIQMRRGQAVDAAGLTPYYIRRSEAERASENASLIDKSALIV